MGLGDKIFFHVDCDNLWIAEEERQSRLDNGSDFLYRAALPKLINIFNEYDIKSTLFVVAKDLNNADYCDFLITCIRQGHAIASHSYSHPKDFKNQNIQIREILMAHKIIREKLRVSPVGFRSPGYSKVQSRSIELLGRLGYRYNSSTLPGLGVFIVALGLLRWRIALIFEKSLDLWSSMFRFKTVIKKKNGIVDIAIGSLPVLRLPIHPSFVFNMPTCYRRYVLRFLRSQRSGGTVLLFHAADLFELKASDEGVKKVFKYQFSRDRFTFLNQLCQACKSKVDLLERVLSVDYCSGRDPQSGGANE